MDQPQPHGNFVAYMNRAKNAGDNKPAFDGRIATPEGDTEHRFALWAHEYTDPKTGEVQVMFNGKTDAVAFTDDPMKQLSAIAKDSAAANKDVTQGSLKLSSGQLVLFPNGFKNDLPLPDKERPDYYGFYNPGDDKPVVRISAWARKDRYQHAMLSGATSHPLPGKTEAEQQNEETNLQDLVDSGAVTKGLKGKGRGKSKTEGASRS